MALSADQVNAYAQRIFNAAIQGTPNNPQGVPPFIADCLVSQSRHETGDYTSNFFSQYNNAFGYGAVDGAYWQNGSSSELADNGAEVATYSSIENSTRELVDWLYRRVREGSFPDLTTVTSVDQYAQLLKNAGYYGDSESNYSADLSRLFQEYIVNPAAAVLANTSTKDIVIVAAVAAVIYLGSQKNV